MKSVTGKLAILVSVLAIAPALAQRITGTIDNGQTVVLSSRVQPLALAQHGDEGLVEPGLKLPWMTLWFSRTPAQEDALAQLLAEQQDSSSPNFHKWLSAQQFASRFGLNPADFEKIETWLQIQGFHIEYLANDRDFIAFSGTADQVQKAFHTEIHRYTVAGESHYMNATAPSIPQQLAGVVLALQGLTDLRPKPRMINRPFTGSGLHPDYTDDGGKHYLAPDDIATIYDIAPLYSSGINGHGQSMVVLGGSNVNPEDLRTFRQTFNLPGNDPRIIECCGVDPGSTGDIVEDEAELDLEWASAVARNASITFVYSMNLFDTAQYAIDQDLAPVISESFGVCEQNASSWGLSSSAYRSLAQTANSKGITWVAPSGDAGAADCDPQFDVDMAADGLAVDFPASIPEVTSVGGTEFNEGSNPSAYWNLNNGPNEGSAKSYIPETAWNESSPVEGLAASGGGVSTFFSKPAWQTGPGVPNDGMRDVPDVALSAALIHVPYIAYQVASDGQSYMFMVGGTSAPTPIVAGIVVLLNQHLASAGAGTAGNINPTLYALAQSNPSIFHDITTGNNIVLCGPGSPNCVNSHLGYSAGPGYDLVTGLGSIDVNRLVTSWPATPTPRTSTTTIVTANPTTIAIGGQTLISARVSPATGAGTPTGSVKFTLGNATLGTVTLSSGTAALTVLGSQLSTGSNTIMGSYGGDTSFLASTGSVSVTVGALVPRNTNTVVTASPTNIFTSGQTQLTAWVSPSSGSGTPTGTVTFSAGSVSLGTAVLAGGTASLPVSGTQLVTGSNTIVASYSGDASFQTSSASVTVTVAAPPSGVTFTATPNPIVSATGSGVTTLSWNAPGYTQLQITVGSPTGTPMTGTLGSSGSAQTGTWVTDGTQFFLIDLTTNTAIDAVVVHVTNAPTLTPVLDSISPNTAQAGSSAFTLQATGANFSASSVVTWNGISLVTQFQSSSLLQANVPASLLTGPETVEVAVATGSLVSASLPFTITNGSQPPPPGITFTASPNPIVSATGSGMTTLTWNAPGYTQLKITVGSPTGNAMTGTLGPSGSAQTGNWVSDGMQFFLVDLTSNTAIASVTVHVVAGQPVTPVLTSISPNTAQSGSGAVTLQALGSNFVTSSVVTWNGASLATQFQSATLLQATVPSSLLAAAGSAQVAVATGSLVSASLPFTITNGSQPPPSGITFTANPNPIVVSSGPLMGTTTLTWNAPGYSNLVVHVNSPSGTALTGTEPSSGSTTTGNWVTNGMQFFLVDANSGTSLASLTMTVESAFGVDDSMMTKSVDMSSGCSIPTAATSFLNTDSSAIVWFLVHGANVGDAAVAQWYGPNGVLFTTGVWDPLTSGGSICLSDGLYIAGHSPATMLGNWKVVVSWNGATLFTLPFTISGSGTNPGTSYNGSWSGTTSQGQPFSMTVSNNDVIAYSYGVNFPDLGPDCPTGMTVSSGPSTSIPISGSSFSSSQLSGTFQSATQASGTINWSENVPGCTASGTLTWTATN